MQFSLKWMLEHDDDNGEQNVGSLSEQFIRRLKRRRPVHPNLQN